MRITMRVVYIMLHVYYIAHLNKLNKSIKSKRLPCSGDVIYFQRPSYTSVTSSKLKKSDHDMAQIEGGHIDDRVGAVPGPDIVYFAKGEPRNVEYCKVFLWKCNIWVLRTRKLPDANFFIHSILRI